jgi:hypothetical protein
MALLISSQAAQRTVAGGTIDIISPRGGTGKRAEAEAAR